jgi:nitrogen regulatory protein P-II 1
MYVVMFILDDPSKLNQVLNAWDEIGVSGATIIDSIGRNRLRKAQQVGAPFMAGINRFLASDIENHYTLFTIVPTEDFIQRCIQALEPIVGDLDQPDTGVLAAWPLSFVKGVNRETNLGQGD